MVTEKGFLGEAAERVPGEYRRLSMWPQRGRGGGTAAMENGAAEVWRDRGNVLAGGDYPTMDKDTFSGII